MSSPEPLPIEKLMMKITTKADRIPSTGYGLIAMKMSLYSLAGIEETSCEPPVFRHPVTEYTHELVNAIWGPYCLS
jgi:hypothetical protein